MSRDFAADETVTVSYRRPRGAGGLWDVEGNQLADVTDAPVAIRAAEAASVTGVAVVSDPGADSTYGSGETIRVAVTFDAAVDVDETSGTPYLTIDMDPADWGEKQAAYQSGSGTSTLTFAHEVVEPNVSTQGISVPANTLALNGGTIRSASGADADLSHDGLAHDPQHKVDWQTAPPAPSGPAPSVPAFDDGERAAFSIAENHADGVAVGTVPATDEDGDALTWSLSGDDTEPFAIGADGTISVKSGTILNYETKSSYAFTATVSDGEDAAGTAEETPSADDTIAVTVTVTNVEEPPGAPTGVTASATSATALSVSWSAPSDSGALDIAGYELRWYAGNADPASESDWTETGDMGAGTSATLANLAADTAYRVQVRARGDGAGPWATGASARTAGPPTVTRVRISSAPAAGDTYELGETIRVTLTFDEAVAVTGTPRLSIDMDPANWGTKRAAYESGSGTTGLVFAHEVVEPNVSTQGIAVLADTLALNGGTIRSQATGDDAVLSHAGLGHDPAHKVDWGATGDTTPPSPVSATVNGNTATVTFDEDLVAVGEDPLHVFFSFTGGGIRPTQATVSGRTVTLRLGGTPAIAGRTYTLDYIGIPLEDAAGNAVASFDGLALQNLTLPVLSAGIATKRVKEGPGATLDFQVTMDAAAAGTVTVDYATAGGTATAGEDYTAVSGTLTFAPGETEKTVPVAIRDDTHDEGEETAGLQLSGPSGATLAGDGRAWGIIVNADPLPNAWLSRFGRTASMHAMDAVGERMRGDARRSGATQFTLGGRRLDGLFGSREPAAEGRDRDGGVESVSSGVPRDETAWQRMDRMKAEALAGGEPSSAGGAGLAGNAEFGSGAAAPGHAHEGSAGGGSVGGGLADAGHAAGHGSEAALLAALQLLDGGNSRLGRGLGLAGGLAGMDWRDAVANSSFDYTAAPDAEGGFPAAWSAWGRGARTRFNGADGALSLQGDVVTATLGADARWGRWTGGIALSHSLGQGAYTAQAAAGGAVESTLTSLHPYGGIELNDRLNLWGMLGYGVGDLTLTPETAGTGIETNLKNAMTAFGGRGVFLRRDGGLELAVVSDAMFTDTRSEAAVGLLAGQGAASRVRLMLEGTGSMPLWNGGTLTPTLEAGVRYDGGDAETGAGMEVGGGLAYVGGRLSVEINARTLVAHQQAEYEEWGFGGTVTWQPDEDGRGLSMSLGSNRGQAASGVDALWGHQDASGLVPGAAAGSDRRLQAELGYGFEGRKGRALWSPFLATQSGDGNRALRIGMKVTSDPNLDARLELGRRFDALGVPEDAFRLQGLVRW